MDYTEEFEALLADESRSFINFICQFPTSEGPTIVRQYKKFMEKKAIENEDYDALEEIQEIDEEADNLENYIIDRNAEIQMKNIKKFAEFRKQLTPFRDEIIDGISEGYKVPPDYVDKLRKYLELEKEYNAYDEEFWKPILSIFKF